MFPLTLSCGRTDYPQPMRPAQDPKSLSPHGGPLESLSIQKCLQRRTKVEHVLSTYCVLTLAHRLLGMQAAPPYYIHKTGLGGLVHSMILGPLAPCALRCQLLVGAESLSGPSGVEPQRV